MLSRSDIQTNSARNIIFALIVFLVFLIGFCFDGAPAGYDIDPSWSAVMSWGLTHGAQWGRDIVFTYGPLSFLSSHFSYYPQLFLTATIGQLTLSALYAGVLAVAIGPANRAILVLFLAGIIVFGAFLAGDVLMSTAYPIALLAMLRIQHAKPRSAITICIAAGCLTAIPWLAKFSMFPLWLIWLSAACCLSMPVRYRLTAVTTSVAVSLLLWSMVGQSLLALPEYLKASWFVAGGYSSAMQRPPNHWLTDSAGLLTLFGAILIAVSFALSTWCSQRDRLAWISIFVAAMLLAFRGGFTRIDETHLLTFFAVVPIVMLLAASYAQIHRPLPLVFAAVIPICGFCLCYSDISATTIYGAVTGRSSCERVISNVANLFSWRALRDKLDAQRESLRKKLDLPEARKAIGNETVDIFKIGQGIVLLNAFNFSPRPIFQGYSAYTPELAQMNADFLQSSRGPAWILFDITAKDQHLPASEDSLALLTILGSYKFVLQESGLLLFQKLSTNSAAAPIVLEEQIANFGERILLPSSKTEAMFVKIATHKTLAARLMSLINREPRLFVELTIDSGEIRIFRLLPATGETGFLISPALAKNAEVVDWLSMSKTHKVNAIRLLQETAFGMPAFESSIHLQWSILDLASGIEH